MRTRSSGSPGNTDPIYVNDGEFVAAAAALRRGDTAPLLRIAANNPGPLFGDGGDPALGCPPA